jgi:hypothetical protein
MIDYTEDVSKWEDWQRDYRLGIILILPPSEVSQQIDPLREKYDPRSFAYCPTHISVSDPLRREMTPDLEDEIRDILKKISPFLLHYDKPNASSEHTGVACSITPQEPIDDLKQALHVASAFAGKVYGRRRIPVHMTIAEFISIEDSLTLSAQLRDSALSGSFLCDRLEFMVPDENFHFHRKGAFLLGGSPKSKNAP